MHRTTTAPAHGRGTPRRTLLLGLCLLPALLGIACAAAPRAADLVALEQRWIEALRTRDTAALDRLLDDSFVDATFRGTVRSKRDVLAGPPAAGAYHSVRLDDVVVRFYGHTAIVTGLNVVQGATAADVARVRFTDVFVRRGGGWRAVSAQETLQASP